MTTEHLKITGMTCSGCASNVERTLKSIKGVKDVVVSLSTSEATVEFDELLTSREQLKSAVVKAGYGAESYENNHHHHKGNSCCGSRESSDKVDPVCRMKVTEKSPHKFNYKNKPFYFCSQSCKTKFEVDPETYLAKNQMLVISIQILARPITLKCQLGQFTLVPCIPRCDKIILGNAQSVAWH